ncbi:MAG: PDZ domain-containing protein [Pseudomonadota bacterium]|nr:PDZ domain-containing protein [Pseudomonadota bacterium]
MNRKHLYLAAAFLTGTLVGAIAAQAYGVALGSGETRATADSTAPVDAGSVSNLPEQESTPEAPHTFALTAAREEIAAVESGAGGNPFEARLQEMTAGRMRLESEVARLQRRVDDLEAELAAVAAAEGEKGGAAQVERPKTPEDRRAVLVNAGVAEDLAADIVWRQGQQELDRLELRDLALREDWFGSDRYREEVDRLDQDAVNVRSEIGDEAYDRYLFASGNDNRVRITSVIPGSAAEGAGLQAGDVVESYAGSRVFAFSELRGATTEGERGDLVPVQIQRGDSVIQAWLPRGPLGVRLDLTRTDPDN